MKKITLSLCLIVLSIYLPNSSCVLAKDSESSTSVRLHPTILKQIEQLPKRPTPRAQIGSLKFEIQVDGGSRSIFEQRHTRVDTGIVATESFSDGGTKLSAQIISLDGFLELAATGHNTARVATPISIPLGKGLFTMGLPISSSMSSAIQVVGLEADMDALINPMPDSKFSYNFVRELQLVTDGTFSSRKERNRRIELKSTCEVGRALPANTLHPKLLGNYLPLTCTSTGSSGSGETKGTSKRAYFIESQLYITLTVEGLKAGNQRTKILDVTYID
jgi:hypothetical protein